MIDDPDPSKSAHHGRAPQQRREQHERAGGPQHTQPVHRHLILEHAEIGKEEDARHRVEQRHDRREHKLDLWHARAKRFKPPPLERVA